MAIKGGQIVHVGNNAVLLDRLQTAGPGTVNIRRETIYELGNYQSVGQVSDIPDLSFTLESFDVSCAMEAFLADRDVKTTHEYDLAASRVVNLKSAFKAGQGAPAEFASVGSAAVPCLRLESVSYRFGIGNNNARQTATLKGDSLYYNPGSTYIQKIAGSNTAGQTIVTDHPAYAITEGGVKRRTLAVTAGERRLLHNVDYTETYGAVTAGAAVTTLVLADAVPTTDNIYVTYSSPDVESFPQWFTRWSRVLLASSPLCVLDRRPRSPPTSTSTTATSSSSMTCPASHGDGNGRCHSTSGSGPYTVQLDTHLVNSHPSGTDVTLYVPDRQAGRHPWPRHRRVHRRFRRGRFGSG